MAENLTYIGLFLGILIATAVIAFLLNSFFKRLIRRSTDDMRNDPTNYKFLRRATVVVVYIVGIAIAIYMMPNLRALASSLLAGAGILAVSVGFASQHALSNIIGGFFIVIFKPFRVNDRLRVQDLSGTVEDITLRHTVIRDYENRRIIIPNSVISEQIIINSDFGDNKICKWIDISIAYDADVKRAKEIIREEVLKHPFSIDPRTPEQKNAGADEVVVRVISLGEYSVNLRGWAWAQDHQSAFQMGCDLLESVKLRFDEEGIVIPFPHRTIVQKQ